MSKKEWKPCCDTMANNFEPSSYGTGIRLVMIINLTTGKERNAFIHKRSRKEKGYFLNYCPWCGLKLENGSIPAKKKAKP